MFAEASEDTKKENGEEKAAEILSAEESLKEKMDRLLLGLQKSDIASYLEMYQHPFKLFGMNIWMGVGRGIGYLIGFAIGGTLLVYILNQIVEINLPVIGDFIAQVVSIVQNQLGEKH